METNVTFAPLLFLDPIETIAMEPIQRILFKKIIELIPSLKTAMPLQDFYIGNQEEGAVVIVKGFNRKPKEKIKVEITSSIPNRIRYNEKKEPEIIELGYRNAPTILLELDKENETIHVQAMRDERPGRTFDEAKSIRNTLNRASEIELEERLNQKFNSYLDEIKALNYKEKKE